MESLLPCNLDGLSRQNSFYKSTGESCIQYNRSKVDLSLDPHIVGVCLLNCMESIIVYVRDEVFWVGTRKLMRKSR